MLKLMQIDGYLGRLKDDKNWKKLCVTQAVHPDDLNNSRYLNTIYPLAESSIDQVNRSLLQTRIDRLDLSKAEDPRSPDLFERLLKRSSKQLLYRYESQEIEMLDKPLLYLLRNSIFGQHGYNFSTPKLHKFAYRRGWKELTKYHSWDTISAVELCNGYYLDEMHPTPELGAIGRGVLISETNAIPDALKAEACACLAQPKFGIDCHEERGVSFAAQFHDFVDLIIDIKEGSSGAATWTFIDELSVPKDQRDDFNKHCAV